MFQNKLITILFLIAAFHLNAQDFREDLDKILKNMDTAKSVSLTASVNVYSKKGGSSFFSANASLKKNASASYTVLDDQEYYSNGNYFISIDHDEKRVAVIKNDEKKNNQSVKGLDIDLKEFKKLLSKEASEDKIGIRLISAEEGKKVYSITNIPSLKEVRIILDMKHLSISSLTYEYKQESEYKGQYIVVSYTKFDPDTDVAASLKQSNFFTISEGKAVLNNRLKGYQLYTEL